MMGLTERQASALVFIRTHIAERGVAPTLDEIATDLGLSSKGQVSDVLRALERRGAIRRLPQRARAIEIITDTDTLARVSDAALLAEVQRRGLQ